MAPGEKTYGLTPFLALKTDHVLKAHSSPEALSNFSLSQRQEGCFAQPHRALFFFRLNSSWAVLLIFDIPRLLPLCTHFLS
jgi:hypothetical protein